ncbi:reticulocyte binding protein, putative [Plasmodium gallinaceum]|uniref:Reticulocyte binding protein, putative n=1 Tax=Plasmodium gallinaceum TaxID=5849 RepID=A0A1J1GTH5_PLAGA|nr:reticulocyte binding protein, putative [Plasmodium gallinaceum]CRG95530.1 reticulocyte binding protein, putative [Plasmodium gallinaceum]
MKKKKFRVTFLSLLFALFGISHEIEDKNALNKFKYNDNNLLFYSNIEESKELENNSIIRYNNKGKEKYKTFNNLGENRYNKRSKKFRNVNIKASHSPRSISSVKLGNSNENTNASYFSYIKKNTPYSSNTYIIKEENGKDKVNGITNSFIHTASIRSIESDTLKEYDSFMRLIDEKLTNAKNSYIISNSYGELKSFFNDSHRTKFVRHSSNVVSTLIDCDFNLIKFCKNSKVEMRKKFYDLLLLSEDAEKRDLFNNDLRLFKSKINEDIKAATNYYNECKKKDEKAFLLVDNYIKKEFCNNQGCNPYKCSSRVCTYVLLHMYKKVIRYYLVARKLHKEDENFLREVENFLNYDKILLRIKEESFCKKKAKNSLKVIIEEIMDIKDNYKKNIDAIRYNYEMLDIAEKNSNNKSFKKSTITRDLSYITSLGMGLHHYKIWNEKLKQLFYVFKSDTYSIYIKEVQNFGREIILLTYPESVKSESEQIILNSQEIFNNIKSIIGKYVESLEYLSRAYNSPEIISIQNELNTLCGELSLYNTRVEEKMNLLNEKYNSIKSKPINIEKLKSELPLSKENNLTDVTEKILSIKKNIENIIATASDDLSILRDNYSDLQRLKNEISSLDKQINEKKSNLQKLKGQEDKNKQISIQKIRQFLEEMSNKKNDLQLIINLKSSENKDLKIIEILINETSFNDEKYLREKQEVNEKIDSALRSLFEDGMLEKLFEEISQFIAEKKSLNYENYSLDRINELLEDTTKKHTKIVQGVKDASSIVENDIKPANNKIIDLKNSIITKLLDDLHKKMNNSLSDFNRISNLASTNIDNYEANKDTLKSYENNIVRRKNEFLNNFFEDDNDVLEGTNIFQKTLDLENTIFDNKNEIKKQISDEEDSVNTIREHLDLYNKLNLYFDICPDTKIVDNIKSIKEQIDKINVHNKLSEHQMKFNNATTSIESSINLINFSNSVIESSKILNNIINESNKNKLLIDNLKENADTLRDKIIKETIIINGEHLIEENIKAKYLSKLKEKESDTDDKIHKVNDLGEKSNAILQLSKKLKENVRNAPTEENVKTLSESISRKKVDLRDIIDKINETKLSVASLNLEIDNIINIQNTEISNLFHNRIIELDQQINDETEKNIDILERTKRNSENYNSENDIKNLIKENNKEMLKKASQLIINLIDIIESHKNKLVSIKSESKEQVNLSNYQKHNNENSKEKKDNIKKIYEKMNDIMERLNAEKEKLKPSLIDINIKVLDYKKIIIHDIIFQINDEKKKSEEKIEAINLYKEKIEQLKKNSMIMTLNGLENLNYEDYIRKSQENQKKIIMLYQEVTTINEQISSITPEDNIDNIKINIEHKLKDIKKEKNDIDHALNEIKNMEKMLMNTNFTNIMEDMKRDTQLSKKEEENAKEQFTKSETINKEILSDIKKVQELKDLLISNQDEASIDGAIKEIKIIKDRVTTNEENINDFLTKAEEHKEATKIYFNNIKRGKNKMEYLKHHDQHEKKKITENIIDSINKYVNESEECLNNAEKHFLATRKNCELSSQYKQNMNDLFYESLFLAEKMKIEMKKSYVTNIFSGIKDEYTSIQKLLEKLGKRLNILKEDVNIEEEYEANNGNSTEAYSQIQIIRTNANNVLLNMEEIKQRVLEILNNSQNEVESIPTYSGRDEFTLSNLEIKQNDLRIVSEILEKLEKKKSTLNIELTKLKDIETNVSSMEGEMEISKKSYEEGILKKIKKIAYQKKEAIESLKKSINLIISTTVTFFRESSAKKKDVELIFEEHKNTMNTICESFDKSYEAIESSILCILDVSTTYNDMKEKKKKAQIEIKKLEEQERELEKLMDNINNAKKKEVLRFIFDMKEELHKMNEKSEEENFQVRENVESIKRNIENIKNSDNVSSALNELNETKIKYSEIKKRQLEHSSYKDKANNVYEEIDKAAKFIGIDIETETKFEGYENIINAKQTILKIQEISSDINIKLEESENINILADNIYEQAKLRDELKKKTKYMINKIDDILGKVQGAHEKYEKIKEINIDNEYYDEILKKDKEYENFKKLSTSYLSELNKIDRELKINTIKTELNDNKDSLNNLEQIIEKSKMEESSLTVLEKAKNDIDTITEKINNMHDSVIEVETSFNELLEQGKNCKLSLKSLIITTINVEISKELLTIQKKKENSTSCVEYIKNVYSSITNDINSLNKSYNENHLSIYKSNNVENANNFSEEFKRKEGEIMKIIEAIQNSILEVDDNKNINELDGKLKELKNLYKKFKEEEMCINDIYKNINYTQLKEMEKISEKFIDLAKSHENIIETQKHKFLNNQNKLKEIEDFTKKKEQEMLLTENTNSDYLQKINSIYEEITHKVTKLNEFENDNSSENNKMILYEEKISYLIERTKSILKDIEQYQYENDYDLLEVRERTLEDVNNYKKEIKKKISESKEIFENIKNNIEKNKGLFQEISYAISSIHVIIKSLNQMKTNHQRKSIEQEESTENHLEKSIKNHLEESTKNHLEESTQNNLEESTQNNLEESTQNELEKSTENNLENSTENHLEKSIKNHLEESTKNHLEESTQNNLENSTENHLEKSTENHLEESTKNHLEEISKTENTGVSIRNNINKNFHHGKSHQESNEKDEKKKKSNFVNETVRIAGGICGGLLVCSCVIFSILYKNENSENDFDDNDVLEYENCSHLGDSCQKDETIEVNFVEEENF